LKERATLTAIVIVSNDSSHDELVLTAYYVPKEKLESSLELTYLVITILRQLNLAYYKLS
jgi:hypothetical protein